MTIAPLITSFFLINIILVLLTAIFYLDFILPLLVGVLLSGFIFFISVVFSRKMMKSASAKPFLLSYVVKYIFSALYLYIAIVIFNIEPLPLLFGLSTVVFSVLIFMGTLITK